MNELKAWPLLATLTVLLLFFRPVLAQTQPMPSGVARTDRPSAYAAEPSTGKAGWTLVVGLASTPVYEGSNERRDRMGAELYYKWNNGVALGTNGFTVDLSTHPDYQYGVGLRFASGRKEGDSKYLKGMGDVKDQGVFVGYVSTSLGHGFGLNSSLELGSGNTRNGAVLKIGGSVDLPINSSLALNFSIGASIANSDYMANYFGVSAAQSAASGYAVYTPSAGLRNATAGAALNYRLSPSTFLTVGVAASTLSDAAKSSPIARHGNSGSVMAGVGYVF